MKSLLLWWFAILLQIFGTYFHASGNGLSMVALETPSFIVSLEVQLCSSENMYTMIVLFLQTLRDKVSCKGLSTKELTNIYLLQLAEVQVIAWY